jgi:hypothetical protein
VAALPRALFSVPKTRSRSKSLLAPGNLASGLVSRHLARHGAVTRVIAGIVVRLHRRGVYLGVTALHRRGHRAASVCGSRHRRREVRSRRRSGLRRRRIFVLLDRAGVRKLAQHAAVTAIRAGAAGVAARSLAAVVHHVGEHHSATAAPIPHAVNAERAESVVLAAADGDPAARGAAAAIAPTPGGSFLRGHPEAEQAEEGGGN